VRDLSHPVPGAAAAATANALIAISWAGEGVDGVLLGCSPCAKVGSFMTASVPFRDTFWNVPGWAQIALYVGGVIAIAIFVYGMWQRVTLWRRGLPENRLDRIAERLGRVLTHALGQVRTLSQAYPGVMHAIMFWGFLALFMGTVLATLDWDITLPLFGYKLLKGPFYLFYETVLDMFGLFFVIGLGMAVWRRFVESPARVASAVFDSPAARRSSTKTMAASSIECASRRKRAAPAAVRIGDRTGEGSSTTPPPIVIGGEYCRKTKRSPRVSTAGRSRRSRACRAVWLSAWFSDCAAARATRPRSSLVP